MSVLELLLCKELSCDGRDQDTDEGDTVRGEVVCHPGVADGEVGQGLVNELDGGGDHHELDCDRSEGGVDKHRPRVTGVTAHSDRQLLDLEIEAHVHPEQVDGHRHQQQRQTFEVHCQDHPDLFSGQGVLFNVSFA